MSKDKNDGDSKMKTLLKFAASVSLLLTAFALSALPKEPVPNPPQASIPSQLVIPAPAYEMQIHQTDLQKLERGRKTFRFDTFGDEAFWGDMLKLHQAIEGSQLRGVGAGLSPRSALTLGLKVDSDALSEELIGTLRAGRVNLNDPGVTLELLRLNAVVGVTGFFDGAKLKSVGIQCALCHSTVDNAVTPGIGRRLDGWPNRDLDIGAIVALAPNLQPVADVLGVDQATVRNVLLKWGPGKFDAELLLDGQGFRPDGRSAATLIPPAFGLAGVNLHTWTGWGSVPHWNAFVAISKCTEKERSSIRAWTTSINFQLLPGIILGT